MKNLVYILRMLGDKVEENEKEKEEWKGWKFQFFWSFCSLQNVFSCEFRKAVFLLM